MDCKLTKYSLWCPEHAETLDTDYRTDDQGLPTCCPLNSEHTSISGVAIVDTIDSTIERTRIVDTDKMDPDTANTLNWGLPFNVQANGDITEWSYVLVHDTEFVCGESYIEKDDANWEYGDKIDFFICPANQGAGIGVIGQVTQNASSGQKTIFIDPEAAALLKPTFFLCFGANVKGTIAYAVNAVNPETGEITLLTNLEADVSIGTLVYLRVYYLTDWPVYRGVVQVFSGHTPGAKNMPAGYKLFILYKHKTPPVASYSRYFGLVEKY